MIATTIFAGLAVWLATTILVESELFRPLREWMEDREYASKAPNHYAPWLRVIDTRRSRFWFKAGYLVHCHLCAGTWIGLVVATIVPGPYAATVDNTVLAVVLAGLTYKAIGHLVLTIEGALKS